MSAIQPHWRRVLSTTALAVLVCFYIATRVGEWNRELRHRHTNRTWKAPRPHAYQQENGMYSEEQPEGVEEKRRGSTIVGSTKDIEFLDEEIPTNITFPTRRTICSRGGAFSQANLGGCPDYNCQLVAGSCDGTSDAVIFNMGASDSGTSWRTPHQYFVFMSQESPLHSTSSAPSPDFYNLTMGYRRDSGVPCPYGYVVETPTENLPTDEEWSGLLKTKTKPMAWFVSNCNAPSGRQKYVEQLKKYVSVDVYGRCGTLSCPKPQSKCVDKLNKEYRFYLAFENSICAGYITEKLWQQGLQSLLIPVVLKDSIVRDILPPNSYLAVDNFKNVKEFAERVLQLMTDDEEYTKMVLGWRRHNKVIFLNGVTHRLEERPWGFCRLCWMIQQEKREQHIIADFTKWWRTDAQCDSGQLANRLIAADP